MARVTRDWRIYTDQPSSGRPIQVQRDQFQTNGFFTTDWSDIAEARDFSVPDTGEDGVTLDPDNPDRELRPGEFYFETPLGIVSYVDVPCWFEIRLIQQGGNMIPGLQEMIIAPKITIPPREVVFFPLQGFRLFKTNFDAAYGDRLQGKAEFETAIKVWGSAVELEYAAHAPDTEA